MMEVKIPVFRSGFNSDRDADSLAASAPQDDEAVVQQHFKEECDINTLVRRFGLTGQLPPGSVRAPQFGDFSGVTDFHSALNAVAQANEAFDALPGAVRERFNFDPQALMAFCADERNKQEAEKLGLVLPKPAVAVPPVVGDGQIAAARAAAAGASPVAPGPAVTTPVASGS